jgi:uncharacterized protein (DUF302 family)
MQDRECEEIIETAEGPSVCAPSEQHAELETDAVQETCAYGMKVWVRFSHDEALAAVRHALAERGFIIAWEMDVRALMHEKLGIAYPGYTILGVSDPTTMHEALDLDRDMGLMLPFHVIVYQQGGGSVIAAIDTIAEMAIADGRDLRELARTSKEKLREVIDRVAAGVS